MSAANHRDRPRDNEHRVAHENSNIAKRAVMEVRVLERDKRTMLRLYGINRKRILGYHDRLVGRMDEIINEREAHEQRQRLLRASNKRTTKASIEVYLPPIGSPSQNPIAVDSAESQAVSGGLHSTVQWGETSAWRRSAGPSMSRSHHISTTALRTARKVAGANKVNVSQRDRFYLAIMLRQRESIRHKVEHYPVKYIDDLPQPKELCIPSVPGKFLKLTEASVSALPAASTQKI